MANARKRPGAGLESTAPKLQAAKSRNPVGGDDPRRRQYNPEWFLYDPASQSYNQYHGHSFKPPRHFLAPDESNVEKELQDFRDQGELQDLRDQECSLQETVNLLRGLGRGEEMRVGDEASVSYGNSGALADEDAPGDGKPDGEAAVDEGHDVDEGDPRGGEAECESVAAGNQVDTAADGAASADEGQPPAYDTSLDRRSIFPSVGGNRSCRLARPWTTLGGEQNGATKKSKTREMRFP